MSNKTTTLDPVNVYGDPIPSGSIPVQQDPVPQLPPGAVQGPPPTDQPEERREYYKNSPGIYI